MTIAERVATLLAHAGRLRATLRGICAHPPGESWDVARAQIAILEDSSELVAAAKLFLPDGYYERHEERQDSHHGAVIKAWLDVFHAMNFHPLNRSKGYGPGSEEERIAAGIAIVSGAMLALVPSLTTAAIAGVRAKYAQDLPPYTDVHADALSDSAGAVDPLEEPRS